MHARDPAIVDVIRASGTTGARCWTSHSGLQRALESSKSLSVTAIQSHLGSTSIRANYRIRVAVEVNEPLQCTVICLSRYRADPVCQLRKSFP